MAMYAAFGAAWGYWTLFLCVVGLVDRTQDKPLVSIEYQLVLNPGLNFTSYRKRIHTHDMKKELFSSRHKVSFKSLDLGFEWLNHDFG